ncbi:hypothetical protein [Treponema sp.]|uniref:hypothetical protein n=1 Tax=Treponema sp. TaxID=166 RepID=UPI00298DC435|nr:hypothetical protein [Treponema sp.]MCR5614011.1 hypothetical protein [Treponema sp.]
MKKIFSELADRNNYSVFVVDGAVKESDYFKKNYPYKIKNENKYVVKNGKSRIYYLFKTPVEHNKVISSLYVLNRNRKYTGTIFIQNRKYCEEIYLKKGLLVFSRLKDKIDEKDIDKHSAKIEKLPSELYAQKKDMFFFESKRYRLFNVLKIVAIFFVSIIALFVLCFRIHKNAVKEFASKQILAQKENERLLKEKSDKEKLSALEKKYVEQEKGKTLEIYKTLSIIHKCLGTDSYINDLSIDGNFFELNLSTKNALLVLSDFEKNKNIEFIKLNQSSVSQNEEYASFSGKVKRAYVMPDEKLNINEKILFYERNIFDFVNLENLSTYAEQIRAILEKSLCKEEYIQIKTSGKTFELECYLKSLGENLLSFIYACESESIKIKSVKIRNEKFRQCSALIRFDTGILEDSVKKTDNLSDVVKLDFAVNSIATVFEDKKKNNHRQYIKVSDFPEKPVLNSFENSMLKKPEKSSEKVNLKNSLPEKLFYIGNAVNKQNEKIIFAKSRDDKIYKIPFRENLTQESCFCIPGIKSNYIAYIDGKNFEVVR